MKRNSTQLEVLPPELECRKSIFELFQGGPKKRAQAFMRMFPGPALTLEQFMNTLEPHFPANVWPHYASRTDLFVKILSSTLTNWTVNQPIPIPQFAEQWMRREYSRHTTKRWRVPESHKRAKVSTPPPPIVEPPRQFSQPGFAALEPRFTLLPVDKALAMAYAQESEYMHQIVYHLQQIQAKNPIWAVPALYSSPEPEEPLRSMDWSPADPTFEDSLPDLPDFGINAATKPTQMEIPVCPAPAASGRPEDLFLDYENLLF